MSQNSRSRLLVRTASRVARRSLAALALAAGLVGALGQLPAAAQSGSLPFVPPPGAQDRGTPPDFQSYPLLSRIFGFGGAIFPGYVSASNGRNGDRLAYLTGGPEGSMIFAAGTVDRLCQMGQAPTIRVLTKPDNVRLTFDIGAFTARRNDSGSRLCIGRTIEGRRVFAAGRAPAGSTVTLRVTYPFVGLSYTHTVALPSK